MLKDKENNDKKIVVLIDADNAQKSKLSLILSELSSYGRVIVKRAYGDWSDVRFKNWSNTLNELVIKPQHQFAYTTGKNATDISMIIDAMDLLYSKRFDAFAIVSSDSDFTALASRLKESEIYVFGFGERKTPLAFRNACDNFIFTENLKTEDELKEEMQKQEYDLLAKEAVKILYEVWQKHSDDEGWINAAVTGQMVKRLYPDFDPRTYGAKKIGELIENLKAYFIITKSPTGKGTTTIINFQPNRKAKNFIKKQSIV
ncbi:MAG: hypothetical protein CR967_03070 [Proteobacteria bacterium]|nr:MAG: hypothetical protein CR967_03070 [Pseudomonadota bacterium]